MSRHRGGFDVCGADRGLADRVGVDVETLAYRTGYRVMVGVMRGLEVVYLEAANGYLAQARRVCVPVVTEPRAALRITGTGV